MKNINKKYLAAAVLAGGAAFFPLAGSASAQSYTSGTTKIPVNMTTTASSTVNVEVSDSITMTLAANSTNATVSNIVIKNKSTVAPVKVTKLTLAANTGWSKAAYSSNFSQEAANTKKFALQLTDVQPTTSGSAGTKTTLNTDLNSDFTPTTNNIVPAASGTTEATYGLLTYTLAGKAPITTSALNAEKVGEITPTITL